MSDFSRRCLRPSTHRPLSLALVLLVVAAFLACVTTQAQQLSATYTRGTLSVTFPYHSTHDGTGKLIAEILDPEGNILGRAERTADIAQGDHSWQQAITPEKPIAIDDIIWQRVRCRFVYDDSAQPSIEAVETISGILRRPVVHILGQSDYLAGSEAALRVIVSSAHEGDDDPSLVQSGTVRVELVVPDQPGHDAEKPVPLFSGRLNRRGTLEARFRFPAGLTGAVSLHFVADTPIGSSEYTQSIHLADKSSILLTTEKPIYQPGQTIHVRALALQRAANQADAGRKLTFEIEDSRGNKVFKKATETDKFGIASAEFSLADEVNLGTYHLRALMGETASPTNTAELALSVERYVLPKFKVDVEFTQKDGKPQRDYRPGDHVTGTVHANYFFGKPVDRAEITIKASALDVAVFEAASATGKTDADGAYHFDLKLPTYFAGRPLSQGAARALVEATVKDSAAHSEVRGEPITISESPLLITAVPEGGTLIPHIENQVFLLTSYPDGTPANTALTVHVSDRDIRRVSTDAGGVAVIRINPGDGIPTLQVDADDHHGKRTSASIPLETRGGTDQVLLRTDRAVVKAGDRIQLKVLSTRASGPAYIDVVKNGQTIMTRDLDLQNGHAELTLNATPDMAGTLDIDAYLFGRDAQPVADHRLLFVQPADELKIETTADAAVYKPGDDARIHFHVTNARGEGVSAALGIQIVDEAVFALAEKQPGFAKVFFYLEQEVMKPRYEIHSLSMSDVVEPIDSAAQGEQQNLAARALFSATELARPAKLDVEFGRTLPQDKSAEYQQRYRQAFYVQVGELNNAPLTYPLPARDSATLTLADGTQPRDAWDTPLRIEASNLNWGGRRYLIIRSAGPDHRFNTADDLVAPVIVDTEQQASTRVLASPGQGGSLDLAIEHDRGPFNGLAEVAGTVADPGGTAAAGIGVSLRALSSQQTRTARANAQGEFTFAGLPAGKYEVRITSPGFQGIAREISLEPRDRAVLTAKFAVRSGGGGIEGTITDPTGAVIPGAEVTATNTDTGVATTQKTSRNGTYSIQPLQPGPYIVEVVAKGFQRLLQENITVDNPSVIGLDLKLTVGGANTTITVTAAPAFLNTTDATLGGTIENQLYSQLPLSMNGGPRNPTAFQHLMPGVAMDAVDAFSADRLQGNSGIYAGTGQTDLNENYIEGVPVSNIAQRGSFSLRVSAAAGAAPPAPHIRSYFPEALYINPEIVTDSAGNADISIPVADSITTWRMAMLASTPSGALGTGTGSLKVFQDFFVDLDLPVTLTQGDHVTIPVAIYNYSGKSGKVSLKLQPDADTWYSLDNDVEEKSVSVESGRVGGSSFTLIANRIGKFKLTLTAQMDSHDNAGARNDIVVREIEVIPNGREQSLVFNGRLDADSGGSVHHDLNFPAISVPDATSVLVRLYPGPLSQVIEGMDSILRMPNGCFEQTSSSTYPNVLALDYMKRTKKLTPEVHAKAEGYIANGYQRLLTFEVPGGGFSWFGQAPANKILTAYGLMEFNDMSKVSDVDPRLIQRTSDWLARQQQPDGSWKPDTSFINEGATNRYNSDVLRITAYIAWALADTGYRGPAVEKARQYIESHASSKPDSYTLAIIANFAADYAKDRDFTSRSMQALIDARTEKGEQVFWSAEETGVYSTGSSAAIETTGLAAQALLKWGQANETARKAITYISSKKEASGNWGTTQATIMALRAILLASEASAADARGTVNIVLDGKTVQTLTLTPDNNDLFQQFVFKGIDAAKPATVELRYSGSGGLAYQVAGRYFTPWEAKPSAEPLSIDVAYDRTHLAENDIATATATIRNNLTKTANMVMVDLGIPPGFELLSEDLQAFQEKTAGAKAGRLEKFSQTATQAILYFNALGPKQTVTVSIRLRAKYPIRARTFQSRVYEYYDPAVNATAVPVQLEVGQH